MHYDQCDILKMIRYLVVFVDKLDRIQPGENESYLPSPEALKEKILIKVTVSSPTQYKVGWFFNANHTFCLSFFGPKLVHPV